MLKGDYQGAIATADKMVRFITPFMSKHPNLADNLIVPVEINLYFKNWKSLLDLPLPDVNDPFTQAYYRYGRAMSYINLGDDAAYRREKAEMKAFQQKIASIDVLYTSIIKLASLILDAEEVKATPASYIAKLEEAVNVQDNQDYGEPPLWYLPLRAQLGDALLENKDYAKAESTFRRGLKEYYRNPRLLKGLYQSLSGQNKEWDAFWVQSELIKAEQK